MTKFTAEFQTCPLLKLKNMVLKRAMEIDISDKRKRNKTFDFLQKKIKKKRRGKFGLLFSKANINIKKKSDKSVARTTMYFSQSKKESR